VYEMDHCRVHETSVPIAVVASSLEYVFASLLGAVHVVGALSRWHGHSPQCVL